MWNIYEIRQGFIIRCKSTFKVVIELNIMQLLKMDKFDVNEKAMLIKHTSGEVGDINEIYESGKLIDYQSVQTEDIFKGVRYLLAFIGTKGTRAKFIGIYEIIESFKIKDRKNTINCADNFGVKNFIIGKKKQTTF